jgi:hypothetical protein
MGNTRFNPSIRTLGLSQRTQVPPASPETAGGDDVQIDPHS